MQELDYYLSQSAVLMYGYAAVVIAIAFIARSLPVGVLAFWLSMCGVYVAARLYSILTWRKQSAEERVTYLYRWQVSTHALLLFQGLIWVVFCVVGMPALSVLGLSVVTWIILLTLTVASVSGPLHSSSFYVYTFMSVASCAYAWVLNGDDSSLFIAGSLFFFSVVNCITWTKYANAVKDRLRLSAQLMQSNDLLREASATKTRMMAEASHDLRQPVHALGLMLDGMGEDAGALAPGDKRIEQFRMCVDSLDNMLSQLMDLSRLESGEYIKSVGLVDIHKLLMETYNCFEPEAKSKGLTFSVPDVHAWVSSDEGLLRRIFYNLVSNAVKYTQLGGVRVSVAQAHGKLRVSVADTGKGIPEEDLPAIFRAYVRLGASSMAESGLGVGLAVVSRAVGLLGHQLDVKSQVGKGSVFSVQFDLVEVPDLPPLAGQAAKKPGQEVDWGSASLLVIENDPILRDSMQSLFSSWGAKVLLFSTGDDAIAAARNDHLRHPSIIVADMHLGGGMDGISTIEKLRRYWEETSIPALLLTGDLSPKVNEMASASKITVAYKPIRSARIREIILKALVRGDARLDSSLMASTF